MWTPAPSRRTTSPPTGSSSTPEVALGPIGTGGHEHLSVPILALPRPSSPTQRGCTMTIEGVDYAYGRLTAQDLAANGLAFAARYVSRFGRRKNLSAGEIADWSANRIGIVICFE